MTIVTKSITEKKVDKQQQPLVQDEAALPVKTPGEAEEATHVYLTFPSRHSRRVSTATTVCVFLTSLLILTVGIVVGVYLYKQYAHAKQMDKYHTWCSVPYIDDTEYRSSSSRLFANQASASQTAGNSQEDDSYEEESNESQQPVSTYFKEEFEIDMEYETYEQIDVPDFRGGRRGRFIHDFSANKTGIIDLDGQRCFVMPLNRSQVLPPHSLFDLVVKMKAGYYEVDTEVVRETMRVVRPPITDYRRVGYYIARECAELPTYMLKRSTSPVFKRSANTKNYQFTEFAGHKVIQFQIISEEEESNVALEK
jgi:integral membrane protein 2B